MVNLVFRFPEGTIREVAEKCPEKDLDNLRVSFVFTYQDLNGDQVTSSMGGEWMKCQEALCKILESNGLPLQYCQPEGETEETVDTWYEVWISEFVC